MTDILDNLTNEPGKEPEDKSDPQSPADLVGVLVGDGKKFKTVEDLAKSKIAADDHIKTVESENAKLRQALSEANEKAAKSVALTDILSEIKKVGQTEPGKDSPNVSEDDILELVDQRLKARDEQALRRSNRSLVNSALLEHFEGNVEKAQGHLKTVAKQLGLDKDKIVTLSEESPKAFLTLLGVGEKKGTSRSTSVAGISNVNSEAFASIPSSERKNSWYMQKRRELGHSKFWSDKVLVSEMYRQMDKLGESFFSG